VSVGEARCTSIPRRDSDLCGRNPARMSKGYVCIYLWIYICRGFRGFQILNFPFFFVAHTVSTVMFFTVHGETWRCMIPSPHEGNQKHHSLSFIIIPFNVEGSFQDGRSLTSNHVERSRASRSETMSSDRHNSRSIFAKCQSLGLSRQNEPWKPRELPQLSMIRRLRSSNE